MMKKVVLTVLISCMMFAFFACDDNSSQITVNIPEITGLDISSARLAINGEFKLNVISLPTHDYLPGIVIQYGNNLVAGNPVTKGSTVDVIVAIAPENSYSMDESIEYVSQIGYLTGPDSINYDLLRDAGVGGTDLGIPIDLGDEFILLYGDTFSSVGSFSGLWNSNFIARSTDQAFTDGLTFSSLITNQFGMIKPISQGAHQGNLSDTESDNPMREVTKIPTGGLKIGDTVYIFYMSVRYWGVSGEWLVTYNQVVKSTDDLQTFTPVDGLVWSETEAPNFGQIYAIQDPNDPDMIYLIGIPGGRSGGTCLARVATADFENKAEYEYYLGGGVWSKGSTGLASLKNNPYYIINPMCSEMSIMYNDYLGKWMVVYLKNSQIVMQTADEISGPWSTIITLTDSSKFYGFYGGFISSYLTKYDGKKFYIIISQWLPIYQTVLVEVVLK
jgi:hypothetical protein